MWRALLCLVAALASAPADGLTPQQASPLVFAAQLTRPLVVRGSGGAVSASGSVVASLRESFPATLGELAVALQAQGALGRVKLYVSRERNMVKGITARPYGTPVHLLDVLSVLTLRDKMPGTCSYGASYTPGCLRCDRRLCPAYLRSREATWHPQEVFGACAACVLQGIRWGTQG